MRNDQFFWFCMSKCCSSPSQDDWFDSIQELQNMQLLSGANTWTISSLFQSTLDSEAEAEDCLLKFHLEQCNKAFFFSIFYKVQMFVK